MKTKKVLLMFALSFVVMFLSTYAMIDTIDHMYLNINKVYMATLMTGLMGIINTILMGQMYSDKKVKLSIFLVSAVAVVFSFFLIRTQGFVGDRSFLESMIPHHSSALVMCNQANIQNPEIAELCDDIVATQLREIEIMQELLEKYN